MEEILVRALKLDQAQVLIQVALDLIPGGDSEVYEEFKNLRINLSGCQGLIVRKANEARAEHRNQLLYGNSCAGESYSEAGEAGHNAWMEH